MSGGIDTYNGGAMVAMKGKDCIAIACDRRLGAQFQTVATNFQKVFKIQNNVLLGLTGLATDIQTLLLNSSNFSSQSMQQKVNLYRLRENREMKASTFASLVSTSLYEKRFGPYFVGSIVAGLDKGVPVLVDYDSIGCTSEVDFSTSGTASDELLGNAEAFFRPGMEREEVAEAVGQALLAGIDRDILSGWGGVVYIM